jgi:hypothetical protein
MFSVFEAFAATVVTTGRIISQNFHSRWPCAPKHGRVRDTFSEVAAIRGDTRRS